MTHRFLAVLLFGMLALVALDGFELRAVQRENTAPSMTSSIAYAPEVTAMDGGNPYPPVKKY